MPSCNLTGEMRRRHTVGGEDGGGEMGNGGSASGGASDGASGGDSASGSRRVLLSASAHYDILHTTTCGDDVI